MNSNKLRPVTVWFTGLSASGKTTLSQRLKADLSEKGINNIKFLDGEDLRDKLQNSKYSTNDRNSLGIVKAQLAFEYNKKGKIVIITGIAHHKETRKKIRKLIPHYFEVYLKCSVKVCAKRDFKGHYQKAFAGEYKDFIGVTEPYQESDSADLVLDTSSMSITECASIIFKVTSSFINTPVQ